MPNSGKIATILGNVLTDSQIDLSTKADLVDGKIPSSQLPSYVDDILEYANLATFPATGSTGIIYVAQDTNKIYRWTGSAYAEVSPTVGTTWGTITGTLSNQTDLQNALDAKVPTSRTLTINGTALDLSANRSFTVGDVRTDSTYANPAWITSLAYSKITGVPAFLTTESDTLATVTGRGASTTTRTTFTEVGATRAGSDSVAVGPWFRWTNTDESRQMLTQLNASNGLTTWAYNGTAWSSAFTLSQAGAGTFSSSVTTGGTINSGDSITMSGELYYGGITSNRKARAYTTGAEGSATLNHAFWTGSAWSIVSTLTSGGSVNFTGSISAYNFSGSSSGTNTGDQTLAGLGGVAGNSTILSDANAANVTTLGGFYTGFNPTNIPAGQSSGDWGLLTIPLWTGNSAGERYAIQMAANLDGNDNIFMRKFFFNGAVSRSAWYTLLNSNNYSQYALPLSGGTLTGRVTWTTTTSPISFQNNGNTGTYTQTSIYTNQNNNSGDTANGIFIERGFTDTSNTELRHFVIGSRGGGIQWKLDGPGNSTQNGSVTASGLDISNNALLNKVKYTQGNYRIYRNLARFDNYNNGAGALAIYTNIPWSAANMLTIQVKGYRYGDRPFEVTCACYAGEGNFYSPGYYSLAADSIFGGYTWYRDANNKVVLVLGNTSGTYGVQMWVSEYKQGFQSLDTSYADGWTIAKITSTTGLSTGTSIPNKNYTTGEINANSITVTNTGIDVFNAQLRVVNSTSSPALISYSNTANGFAFGFSSTGTQRFVWQNGAPSEIASMNASGQLSLNDGISTLAVSRMKGNSDTVAFALKVAKGSYADSGGHTTLIGLGVEGTTWSRSAIGHTRTSSYDRGYFGIYVSDNNSDGSELSTSHLRVKVDHTGFFQISSSGTPTLSLLQTGYSNAYINYTGGKMVIGGDSGLNDGIYFNTYNGSSYGDRVKISITGTLTASGDIIAYGSPSDITLKTVKSKVDHAIEKVSKLNGYYFDWNNVDPLTNIKEDIGVVAQEVEKIFPELARTNSDGKMSVRYQGLTAVLIEAVKELAAENNKLKEILERNNIQ